MPGRVQQLSKSARLASLGIELAASLGGFALLGYWIDRHYGTAPWGLLICALLGLVGGMYNLVRSALQAVRPPPGEGGEEGADRREGR
jgi:ATP synthase protein I